MTRAAPESGRAALLFLGVPNPRHLSTPAYLALARAAAQRGVAHGTSARRGAQLRPASLVSSLAESPQPWAAGRVRAST